MDLSTTLEQKARRANRNRLFVSGFFLLLILVNLFHFRRYWIGYFRGPQTLSEAQRKSKEKEPGA